MTLDNVLESSSASNSVSWTTTNEYDLGTSMQRVAKCSAGVQGAGGVLIHGDNLAALKLLGRTHKGAVK